MERHIIDLSVSVGWMMNCNNHGSHQDSLRWSKEPTASETAAVGHRKKADTHSPTPLTDLLTMV